MRPGSVIVDLAVEQGGNGAGAVAGAPDRVDTKLLQLVLGSAGRR